jgi:CBS domain-containing protein
MSTTTTERPLTLEPGTARELMVPSPVSIRADATVQEAIVCLTEKGISAAPVIDEAGHPVGVLSRSDVLVHERESLRARNSGAETRAEKMQDRVTAADLMTPAVFAVPLDASVARVVEEMLALNVHRLFVVDTDGVLVGVVTAMDLLRHLR